MPCTRKPDGVFYSQKQQRLLRHEHYSTSIHWSSQMLQLLRDLFPTTPNEELAGIIGVSTRTLIRKARQLGIDKDPQWLRNVWNSHCLIMQATTRRHGNAGQFKPGHHGGQPFPKRPVICTETGRSYPSITAAAQAHHTSPSNISQALRTGRRAAGMHFQYITPLTPANSRYLPITPAISH